MKNAPTHFGPVDYEIVSDADHGKIAATVEDAVAQSAASRCCCGCAIPQAAPIKSVTVNGKPWKDFDAAREVIRLHGLQGTVKVEAVY